LRRYMRARGTPILSTTLIGVVLMMPVLPFPRLPLEALFLHQRRSFVIRFLDAVNEALTALHARYYYGSMDQALRL